MTQPTDAVPLDQFDDVAVRVKDLQLDDEWRAWLHAHAQTEGGLALAFRRMVLFQAVVALLRQSHETEEQLRVYLTEAGYQNADLRRILARWRRGEPIPELAAIAPPASVTPPPPRCTERPANPRRRPR
jgi:hypothetical protein